MSTLEKDVLRMELQIGELIRIVANLNERLRAIEDNHDNRVFIQQIPLARKCKTKNLGV